MISQKSLETLDARDTMLISILVLFIFLQNSLGRFSCGRFVKSLGDFILGFHKPPGGLFGVRFC